MVMPRLMSLFFAAALTTVYCADQTGYQELVARLDILQGKVSTLEANDAAQQLLISHQQYTIRRLEFVLHDVTSGHVLHKNPLQDGEQTSTTRTKMAGKPPMKQQLQHHVARPQKYFPSPKSSKGRPSFHQHPGRSGNSLIPGQHHERMTRQILDPQVAFMARMNRSYDQIGINQNFVFEEVTMNIGNGYHGRQGIFLAPTAGIYLFSATLVYSKVSEQMDAELVHNGVAVCKIVAVGATSWEQASQTTLIVIKVGDEVWLRNVDRSNVSVLGDGYSSFTGYLLSTNVP